MLVSFIVSALFFALDGADGEIGEYIIIGLGLGLFSLVFDTKEEKEEKKAERIRKQKEKEAEEKAKNAPGCYSMDGVDIMTFSSKNNILTSGNNWIRFKLRNKNSYGVIVSVRYKYTDGWESSTHSYEVAGNQIRTVDASGQAWRKATDITIVQVH